MYNGFVGVVNGVFRAVFGFDDHRFGTGINLGHGAVNCGHDIVGCPHRQRKNRHCGYAQNSE
jgi:hypothetical protein